MSLAQTRHLFSSHSALVKAVSHRPQAVRQLVQPVPHLGLYPRRLRQAPRQRPDATLRLQTQTKHAQKNKTL